MGIAFYNISTPYIDYLRLDPKLSHIYDNKDGLGWHGRKYIGIVLNINGFEYYVPLSSPKGTDYDALGNIRKDQIPIIRIVSDDMHGDPEVKGTLRFSHMIPVPITEISPYYFASETDQNYKILVEKEYKFIKSNQNRIYSNASVIYNQKTKEDTLYVGNVKPNYLNSTIDFTYAEKKCKEFTHH